MAGLCGVSVRTTTIIGSFKKSLIWRFFGLKKMKYIGNGLIER